MGFVKNGKWQPDAIDIASGEYQDPSQSCFWRAKDRQTEYDQLRDLTVTIWKMFYQEEVPDFEPLDDILGLITQIDNMVTGLERKADK
jgi:hypothetical protein